jgi:hypothetical protein
MTRTPHVTPQSILLRHQFVLERFIHTADMGNDHAHEKFLCRRDRLLCHIRRRLNDACQLGEWKNSFQTSR